ncbi:MAG: LysE family transporter [Bacteroidales bacterium]|nr:LysE family transporter [Bacteroidales bacterium]
MVGAILQGVLAGLVISVSIGPAFFALIQIGIQRGFKSGIAMSIGVALSDCTLITISYLGFANLLKNTDNRLLVGTIGSVILVAYGLYTLFSKRKSSASSLSLEKEKKQLSFFQKHFGPNASWPVYAIKGYFLNLLNPVTILFWAGLVISVTAMYPNDTQRYVLTFFLSAVVLLLITNLIKVFIGKKIKDLLKPGIIDIINKVIGGILIVCGIGLCIYVWFIM